MDKNFENGKFYRLNLQQLLINKLVLNSFQWRLRLLSNFWLTNFWDKFAFKHGHEIIKKISFHFWLLLIFASFLIKCIFGHIFLFFSNEQSSAMILKQKKKRRQHPKELYLTTLFNRLSLNHLVKKKRNFKKNVFLVHFAAAKDNFYCCSLLKLYNNFKALQLP